MNRRLPPVLTCLLVCALAAGAARAQISPTATEIRLWEQEGNAVVPPERRFYSTRFDASRSRYIGFEITMKHAPAKATGIFPVECELFGSGSDKALKSLNLEVQVVTGAVASNGIALLTRSSDSGWTPGNYRVRCSGRSSLLGEVPFETAINPPDATSGYAGLAMGWDSPGKWSDGYHTAVCNIRGRPVAVERFS
ncbi:MAG: hypothetical protein WBO00_05165, partial [Steroidobacteraceae bacterium]